MIVVVLSLLLSQPQFARTTHFRHIQKSSLPAQLIQHFWCPAPETPEECRQRFQESGDAWAGDVNDDAVDELLIKTGTGGSGGDDLLLFQKKGKEWKEILHAFPYLARLDILPPVRQGYHDLHLDSLHCYKWNGEKYVSYGAEDYRKLKSEYFSILDPENASILWLSRYAGLREFDLDPITFREYPIEKWGFRTKLRDSQQGATYVAQDRGGVWAALGNESFLVMPRPSYLGSEKLELEGDWLVIYGAKRGYGDDTPIARFNLRTRMLVLVGEALTKPYWLIPD